MSYIDINEAWKFSGEDLKRYYKLYIQCVESILCRYEVVDVVINPELFYWAMYEVSIDLHALYSRRLRQGIADAKIMGVMVFRLAKFPVVQICHPVDLSSGKKERLAKLTVYINTLAALLFVGKIFNFEFKKLSSQLIKELLYCIVFRHVNQEFLGLFFEVCLSLME